MRVSPWPGSFYSISQIFSGSAPISGHGALNLEYGAKGFHETLARQDAPKYHEVRPGSDSRFRPPLYLPPVSGGDTEGDGRTTEWQELDSMSETNNSPGFLIQLAA